MKRLMLFVMIILIVGLTAGCKNALKPTDQAPQPTTQVHEPQPTEAPQPTAQVHEPQPTEAPQPTDDSEGSSISISGNTVTVLQDGKTIATVKFMTRVDNMPTEWLKDRPVVYLYQSGIGNRVELEITLMENGAFAMDGDWASAGGIDLGVVNNSADFLLFADQPGTYKVTASSFGLAIGTYNGVDDKAGNVIQDRRNATGWDGRPAFYFSSEGKVINL